MLPSAFWSPFGPKSPVINKDCYSEGYSVPKVKITRLHEESVFRSTEEGVYQPKTKETHAAYEAMLSVIQQQLGGQPLNIVSGDADEILAVLKNDTLKNPDKKKDIEKLLNLRYQVRF